MVRTDKLKLVTLFSREIKFILLRSFFMSICGAQRAKQKLCYWVIVEPQRLQQRLIIIMIIN